MNQENINLYRKVSENLRLYSKEIQIFGFLGQSNGNRDFSNPRIHLNSKSTPKNTPKSFSILEMMRI